MSYFTVISTNHLLTELPKKGCAICGGEEMKNETIGDLLKEFEMIKKYQPSSIVVEEFLYRIKKYSSVDTLIVDVEKYLVGKS